MYALVILHCCVDLFLTTKKDLMIHHILCISLSSFMFVCKLPLEIVSHQALTTLSLEASSIFLVGREYISKKSIFYTLNNMCFISSFFYLRIYLLTKYLFLDEIYLHYITSYITINYNNYLLLLFYFSTYSFLVLNIYWAMLIIKTTIKQIRIQYANLFSYRNTEFLLQYTYFLQPFLTLYSYSSSSTNAIRAVILFDILGQSILAANSYKYHNSLYNKLYNSTDKINILDKNIYKHYIHDIISIQISSYCCIVVNLCILNSKLSYLLLGFTLFLHLSSIFFFYQDILEKIYTNVNLYYDGSNDEFIDYILKVPLVLDICIIMLNSNSLIASNHTFISSVSIGSLLFTKPFYEYNHFVLHLLLYYLLYALHTCNNSLLQL